MTYINLDTAFFRNPKVLRAGKDARDLYIAALMWSRENLTDGHIPRDVLHLLDPTVRDPRRARTLAQQLVNVGLMKGQRGSNGGLTIPDFKRYQQAKEDVERAREQAKERQRRWRDKRVRNAVSNATRAVKEVEKDFKSTSLEVPLDHAVGNGGPPIDDDDLPFDVPPDVTKAME